MLKYANGLLIQRFSTFFELSNTIKMNIWKKSQSIVSYLYLNMYVYIYIYIYSHSGKIYINHNFAKRSIFPHIYSNIHFFTRKKILELKTQLNSWQKNYLFIFNKFRLKNNKRFTTCKKWNINFFSFGFSVFSFLNKLWIFLFW